MPVGRAVRAFSDARVILLPFGAHGTPYMKVRSADPKFERVHALYRLLK